MLKNEKGITLIALIITIIVMLILVGVTINVAINGGLFKKAKTAAEGTKLEGEKEQLLLIVLGAMNDRGIVELDKLDAAIEKTEDFTGEDGTYTSRKTGKIYVVSERGSIVEKKQGLAIEPKKQTYTVGEEVTIGNEHFYVIADDNEKVKLLAKYNLNQSGTAQDTTGASNPCAFSASGNFTEGEDLNNNSTVKTDTTSAVYKAIQYGSEFKTDGVTGRLMTVEEVEELGGNSQNNSTSVCNTNGNGFVNSVNGVSLIYWLGSAESRLYVWYVAGPRGLLTEQKFSGSSTTGVRPVLEIPKSVI